MENKILILLMSCNNELYESEELACRNTFLKDAETLGVKYYFYKSTNKSHPQQMIDNHLNTMFLNVDDTLKGTSQKTVAAFSEALKLDGWDYILKTNVSTWLDIRKIKEAVDSWAGKDDKNVYGARYLANDASMNVPFPRGYFTILSRSLVSGVVEWAPRMMGLKNFPKTDDTLISLSLLYFLQKVSGIKYADHIKEVASITSWSENIEDTREWTDALAIRCKNEPLLSDTPKNMRKVHDLKHNEGAKKNFCRPVEIVETKYGLLPYTTYETIVKFLNVKKEESKNYVVESGTVKRTEPENKLEEIRKRLRGEK